MQSSIFFNSTQNSPIKSRSACKSFLNRLYFSKVMQVLYLLLIFLCILSVILNFALQINFSGNTYPLSKILLILESSICILIVGEISLRIYLQGRQNYCSLSNAVDLSITLLCVVGLCLSLQHDLLHSWGDTTIDTLLVLRNIIFLLRLVIVFKHQDDTKVTSLTISLQGQEEELVTRNIISSGIARKYKPTMDTLFEEEDEEGSMTMDAVWKGKRVNP